jgi:DNA-binding CsgD family transcriptional regulator
VSLRLGTVVAHREMMVAEGVAAALSRYPHVAPVAATTSVEQLDKWADRIQAIALDPYLAGAEEAATRLRRKGVRVVFLGGSGEDDGLRVSTGMPVASLASALSPTNGNGSGAAQSLPLTERQREILALVAQGLAGKQVARHLGISPKTVERHKTRIFARLGVPNQTAAVSLALIGELERSRAWTPSNT